jgi:hypothetical protein
MNNSKKPKLELVPNCADETAAQMRLIEGLTGHQSVVRNIPEGTFLQDTLPSIPRARTISYEPKSAKRETRTQRRLRTSLKISALIGVCLVGSLLAFYVMCLISGYELRLRF